MSQNMVFVVLTIVAIGAAGSVIASVLINRKMNYLEKQMTEFIKPKKKQRINHSRSVRRKKRG